MLTIGTTPGFNQKDTLNSVGKDTKLLSILQTNSSKFIDENGEPLVMIHNSTVSGITEFRPNVGNAIYFADAIGQNYVSGFERGKITTKYF